MSLDRVVIFAVVIALTSSLASSARADESVPKEAPRPSRVPYFVGGAGLTAFIVGVSLMQFANNQDQQARQVEEVGVSGQSSRNTAASARSSGLALMGGGLLVFGAGAVWLIVDRASGARSTALRVAPMLTPHGGGLAFSTSF